MLSADDDEVEERTRQRIEAIHLLDAKSLKKSLNQEVAQSKGPVIMQMNEYEYKGIGLKSNVDPDYRRELIPLTTLMPVGDDSNIPMSECINIQPRDIMMYSNTVHQETKFREIENWDNKGLIIRCVDLKLKLLRSTIRVNFVNTEGVKTRLILRGSTLEIIEAIPFSTVATRFLMKVAHILETIVNNGYNHKFKWKLLFAHPLARQLRTHIAGEDVTLSVDQDVEPSDAVLTTTNLWIHEDDAVYIQQLLKSVVIAAMDNTFREELYKAFNGIVVNYKKLILMNDDFEYGIEFDRLYDRLATLLMDETYYYSKGQIIENVVRATEMLNLDSDVYMIVKHGVKPPTGKLLRLFQAIMDRCIHPYFQFGMLRHRLNVSLYFNGRLRYVVPTFP